MTCWQIAKGAALHILSEAAECFGAAHPQLFPFREGIKKVARFVLIQLYQKHP
jgi:hypothetical protein